MLSKELKEALAELVKLERTVDMLLEVETEGKYKLCQRGAVQLYAAPGFKHDVESLKAIADNVTETYRNPEDGSVHYAFRIGDVPCVIVLQDKSHKESVH